MKSEAVPEYHDSLPALPALICPNFTAESGDTWNNDQWTLTTKTLDMGHYQSRMSLANGYLGINVAAVGPFFEVDVPVAGDSISGWPLFNSRQTFATIAGFYDTQPTTNGTNYEWLNQYGAESVISGVPHWGGLILEINNQTLNSTVNPDSIRNYASTLDIRKGLLKWSYTWTPADGTDINITYTMFVHKLYVNQAAVQVELSATSDTDVKVIDILDGTSAVRADFVHKDYEPETKTIWTAVRPNGIDNITAYIYSTLKTNGCVGSVTPSPFLDYSSGNASTIAQAIEFKLRAHETAVVEKHIGGASHDAFDDPQDVARFASLSGAKTGFGSLLDSHIKEWNSILPEDSVDNYIVPGDDTPPNNDTWLLQITSVTSPFYILQNTVGPNAVEAAGGNKKLDINSISVGGLGSDSYAGLIFWDAEIWMAPGLDMSHPHHIKQITNYRKEKYPQAQENVKMAYSSSQNPTGKFSNGGAVYPWTSGRWGNCTGTGPCFDYEYHINGDIGKQMYNYYSTSGDRDYFEEDLLPIYNAIAYFYSELMDLNKTTGKYELLNATDPDEYANNVDRVGFTTALIQKHLNESNVLSEWFGLPPNDSWTELAGNIVLPTNNEVGIILEYGTMNGSINVKQADVILIDDILDYPNNYSLSDLDYYAAKQSTTGPGMTYGVFSIVANEVSPSGCSSYTYNLVGVEPYVRAPWYQFSEQLGDNFQDNGGTHPAYPFLTGMGGANRVAIFGYLGLRIFPDRLDIDPSLPPQIPYIKYRTFYWQGYAFSATSNQTHTNLTRLANSRALSKANSTYASTPIPISLGTHGDHINTTIAANETHTLSNRLIGQNATVPGNILQCIPATSSQAYIPGQLPIAAIDGAASTKWQPALGNATAVLTVDLAARGGTTATITELRFDWGARPPQMFAVVFSDTADAASLGLELFLPFDAAASYTALGDAPSASLTNVTAQGNVSISAPYDAGRVAVLERIGANTTNVTLEAPVVTRRWAHLLLWGVAGTTNYTGGGATVAEWVMVE
ncbi:acid trehalase [Lophium mytilinum]|uniref:alpha,alpha-trehalase n=1 Tax=Lophium mytilinum TaxID=390894 RepID=A0A6A6R8T0_9PEZI|nr:acid trehalase [Lophium mytilinum]